jgi:hypothetical protein
LSHMLLAPYGMEARDAVLSGRALGSVPSTGPK